MKIVLIGQWAYPEQNPRAQRAWQLGVRLAKDGHDVTLYALLGKEYDYSGIFESCGLKVRNLGISKNGLADSEGRKSKRLVSRVIKTLVNEYALFPGGDFDPMVKRALAREGEMDLLISIASPHAIHWAVAKHIDRTKVRTWVADCGDPFMLNPFDRHRPCMEKLERLWCSKCDFITVPLEEARQSYYPEYSEKIKVIPQGFDFESVKLPEYSPNAIPTFVFAGKAYPGLRDPGNFLKYLSTCGKPLSFVVHTNTPELFTKGAVPEGMTVNGVIPRDELLVRLASADFLVNITNPSTVQSPSKLIDYGLSGRPVLDISSDFTDAERDNFESFLAGDYSCAHSIEGLERYDIRRIASAFIALLA